MTMINAERLAQRLAGDGFLPERDWMEPDSVSLQRQGTYKGVWEIAVASTGGAQNDVVAGHLYCSVVRNPFRVKGLFAWRCLVELARDPEVGNTKLRSTEDARRWEEQFCQTAPTAAREFAMQKAPVLLESTRDVRTRADAIVKSLPSAPLPEGVLAVMEPMCTIAERTHAKRVAGSAGVMLVPDTFDIYYLASLAVLLDLRRRGIETGDLSRALSAESLEVLQLLQLIVSEIT